MALTWHARKVQIHKGSINEIRQQIPYFRRDPFRVENGGMNQHFDIIVRKPLKENHGYLLPDDDTVHIPVATVSRQYNLIQHHDVLQALEDALKQINFDPQRLEAELALTEYGERMRISFFLLGYYFDLDGGDPIVLKVNALNSVDKTTALEINLSLERLVCSNGMTYGISDARFRKIHLQSLLLEDIKEFLKEQLEQFPKEQRLYKNWHQREILHRKLSESKPSPGQIEHWIDKVVAEKWGVHAAARVYHIAKTGYDGEIVKPFEKNVKPHDREVSSVNKVPGSYEYAPVRNAYDIAQVLSWIAGQRGTIQEQLEWMMEIPGLMNALLKTEKPITLITSG